MDREGERRRGIMKGLERTKAKEKGKIKKKRGEGMRKALKAGEAD